MCWLSTEQYANALALQWYLGLQLENNSWPDLQVERFRLLENCGERWNFHKTVSTRFQNIAIIKILDLWCSDSKSRHSHCFVGTIGTQPQKKKIETKRIATSSPQTKALFWHQNFLGELHLVVLFREDEHSALCVHARFFQNHFSMPGCHWVSLTWVSL